MYVPKPFALEDRQALLRFIERAPFGVFVSAPGGAICATHVPFVILQHDEQPVLGLHVARANPQWKDLEGQEVLAIFQGAHARISASWYAQPDRDVPTWDYGAVHCRGIARIADGGSTREILRRMANDLDPDWKMAQADAAYIEKLLQGIVAIRMTVSSMTGALKYSQNRTPEDRARVIERLKASPRCGDQDLAREMLLEFP